VSGYWIWKVNDLNEAIDWVKRCPNPMPGQSVIEVRELYETEERNGQSDGSLTSPRRLLSSPRQRIA
jgi:hypothetical protein